MPQKRPPPERRLEIAETALQYSDAYDGSALKTEPVSPQLADPALEATPFELTYRQLTDLVFERRLAELEATNPGEEKRNRNIAGNLTRAVQAFMQANGLQFDDSVGTEMLDETGWEAARDRMGPTKASQKSLVGKARLWALEALRASEARFAEETFGERLARLRTSSDLGYKRLAASVSTSTNKTDWTVIKNWEIGFRRPSPASRPVVERLEDALGVPPGTLTGMNRPGFTGGQNSRRIARYGTESKEDLKAVFA